MKHLLFAVLLSAHALAAHAADKNVLYVSPKGNGRNTGTMTRPLKGFKADAKIYRRIEGFPQLPFNKIG